MSLCSRRTILRCLGASLGACGLGCSASSSTDAPAPTHHDEVRVPVASLVVGAVFDPSAAGCEASRGVLVGRDEKGVYAYSNVCTHQGGRVPGPDAEGISRCCLHGSRFDRTGALVSGITPGQGDLPHYRLHLEGTGVDAVVVVDLSQEQMDRSARLAL